MSTVRLQQPDAPGDAEPRRIRLLVSVRDTAEAEAALAGGADWIDLKEPSRGPLGAVNIEVAEHVVATVAGQAPVSAAAGELVNWPDGAARDLLAVDGISYVKLGLAECRGRSWQRAWQDARAAIESAGKRLAAVIYADHQAARSPQPLEICQVAQQAACDWILIDTYDKEAGSVLDYLSLSDLHAVIEAERLDELRWVLAGRLTPELIPELPLNRLSMVAVRGAACEGGRRGAVSRDRVAALKKLVTSGAPA